MLVPVGDSYRPAYEHRLAVRALLSSDKRKKAWKLADGTRNQAAIAKESGMTTGNTSTFFKNLRELGAVGEEPNPKRLVDL